MSFNFALLSLTKKHKTMKKSFLLLITLLTINIFFTQSQNTKEIKQPNKEIFTSIENLSDDIKFASFKSLDEQLNTKLKIENSITYKVVSSTKTNYENCFKCSNPRDPYNCAAKYLVEGRKYTEWKDGKATKSWMKTVSIFMGCGRW